MAKTKKEELAWLRFIAATGDVIRQWAELEFYLIQHLCILLKCEDFRARLIWATIPNIRGRFLLLQRLGDTYLDEPSLKEFRKLISRARKLGGKRNLLAHAPWVYQQGNKFTFYGDSEPEEPGGAFDFGSSQTFQLTNIENWVSDIRNVRTELSDLRRFLEQDTLERFPFDVGQAPYPACRK